MDRNTSPLTPLYSSSNRQFIHQIYSQRLSLMRTLTHKLLILHIRLRLPVKRLRITRILESILRGLLRNIHLRHSIRRRRFSKQLALAAPLHERVEIACLVHGRADSYETVISEDHTFAVWTKGGGETVAFFFCEDYAAEVLVRR